MRVIATQRGYDGLCMRDPDDIDPDTKGPVIFDMPDGAKGSWFVEVDDDGKPLVEVKKPKASKTVPGAGPAKGSQQKVDRQYPNGQEPSELA